MEVVFYETLENIFSQMLTENATFIKLIFLGWLITCFLLKTKNPQKIVKSADLTNFLIQNEFYRYIVGQSESNSSIFDCLKIEFYAIHCLKFLQFQLFFSPRKIKVFLKNSKRSLKRGKYNLTNVVPEDTPISSEHRNNRIYRHFTEPTLS